MRKYVLLILLLPVVLPAQQKSTVVTYLSAEYIYIGAGTEDGFLVGDTVQVSHNNQVLGRLKIIYAAGKSASCQALEIKGPIRAGDGVANLSRHNFMVVADSSQARVTSRQRQFAPANRKPPQKDHLKGSLAFSLYGVQQNSAPGSAYSQPLVRFRLKGRDLGLPYLNFDLRFRSRYTSRSFDFSEAFQREEWDHRLYQAVLSYRPPQSAFGYEAGRLQANWLGGVGRIDGALFDAALSRQFRLGIYGGFEPDLQAGDFNSDMSKAGVFVRYEDQRGADRQYSATAAVSGSYYQGTVNRENLNLQFSGRLAGKIFLYSNMELDLNRDWRREKSGRTLALSSLWLNGSYRFNEQWQLNMGLNTRQNYYTYRYRSVADSLFDTANRTGIRASADYNPVPGTRFSAGAGLQDISRINVQSQNWYFRFNQFPLLMRGDRLSLNYFGFVNEWTKGHYLRGNYAWPVLRRMRLDLGSGVNRYEFQTQSGQPQLNSFVRLGADLILPGNFSLNGYYEYQWQENSTSSNYLMELYYIF